MRSSCHNILVSSLLGCKLTGTKCLSEIEWPSINRAASVSLMSTKGIVVWTKVLQVQSRLFVGLAIFIALSSLLNNVLIITILEHLSPLVAQAFLVHFTILHEVEFVFLELARIRLLLIVFLHSILLTTPNFCWIVLRALHSLAKLRSLLIKVCLCIVLVFRVKPLLLSLRLAPFMLFLLFTVGDVCKVCWFAVFCSHHLTFNLAKELVNSRGLTLLVTQQGIPFIVVATRGHQTFILVKSERFPWTSKADGGLIETVAPTDLVERAESSSTLSNAGQARLGGSRCDDWLSHTESC